MSISPFNRSRANRSRHCRTHRGVRSTARAIARLPNPRPASRTARARSATQAPVRPARHRCCNTRRSLGVNRTVVSGSGHPHLACRCLFCFPMPPRICHPGWVPNLWDSALGAPNEWTRHRGLGGTPSSGRPARGARGGQSGHRPHRGPDASVGAAVARALRPRSIERANRHAALRASRPLFPPKNVMMSCPWRVAPAPSCGALVRTGRFGPSLGPRCSGTSSVGSARAPSTDG